QVAKIHGHVYMRHSPDLANWSDWTTVPRFDAQGDRTRHIHAFNLSRPEPEAAAWHRLVRARTAGQPKLRLTRYAQVAAWAAKNRPGYLARVKPFFGYMQFRYEGSFPSRHYLQAIKIRVSQVIPGPVYPGRAEGEDGRAAHEMPWSHRAPGTLPPEATRHREGQSRAVVAAAVQSVIDAATPDGETFQHVSVVERTALGGNLQDLDLGGALPAENPFGTLGTQAWNDVRMRNRRSRLTPGGLPTQPLPSYVSPERASYVMDGGRPPGKEDPEATWARFHARQKKSLGLVWVTEPGIAADGSRAIVHVSVARSATVGSGRWVLLDHAAGAWRVLKTVPTGKR
ncbi:MAG: hypothetical protein P1V36_13345, partial [Planctomycetota bacterium]|nr:hypothetical protein [Planctomycetota bacterium]